MIFLLKQVIFRFQPLVFGSENSFFAENPSPQDVQHNNLPCLTTGQRSVSERVCPHQGETKPYTCGWNASRPRPVVPFVMMSR